jgi:hypothetical protein
MSGLPRRAETVRCIIKERRGDVVANNFNWLMSTGRRRLRL